MELRTLGNSGTIVSEYALGTMTFGAEADEKTSHTIIDTYLDAGGTFIDTADVYSSGGSETIIGRWLADNPGRRDDVVIATKFGFSLEKGHESDLDSRPEHIRTTVEDSLRRLGVESIDLLYQHRVDPEVPIEDVAGAVADLVAAGKVGHFGLSEAAAGTIRRAHADVQF